MLEDLLALKHTRKDSGQAVCDDEGDEDPDSVLEALAWEDPEIQQRNRYLDRAVGDLVQDLIDP